MGKRVVAPLFRCVLSVGLDAEGYLTGYRAYIVDENSRVIDIRTLDKTMQQGVVEALVEAANTIRL